MVTLILYRNDSSSSVDIRSSMVVCCDESTGGDGSSVSGGVADDASSVGTVGDGRYTGGCMCVSLTVVAVVDVSIA